MDDEFEKTQEATPSRRQKAREEGQVARSHDLASAGLLVGAILILMYFGGDVATMVAELTHHQLGTEAWLTADREFAVNQYYSVLYRMAWGTLPILAMLTALAIIVNLGQVGILFLPQKLAMDPHHIDPLSGIQRTLSMSNLVRLGFGIFKIAVVASVGLWSVWKDRDAVMSLASMEVPQIAKFVIDVALWTALKIGAALLVLALFDYGFQRWKHERDLRMTPQQVREEMRNQGGDPQVIARRRSLQRQMVTSRATTAVPRADVIVTNPTELAIAIQYDAERMAAPIVVAKGAGTLAQRIRRLGLEHSVPIVERKELAQFLYKHVDIGHPVPAEQYAAVAEVLRYVYQLKGKPLPRA